MYFFLSIISLGVSTCLAFLLGEITEDKGLNGSCPEVQLAVQDINLHYQNKGDKTPRTFCNVSSAYRQVIVGYKWNWDLNLDLPEKVCAGYMWYLNLIVSTPQKTEICQVDVMARLWLNDSDVFRATKEPICTEGTGQPVVVDINSTEVQNALNFAVAKLNNDSDCPRLWKAVSIGQVTSQIASAVYYNFTDVVMSPTNCAKETTQSLTGCVATQNVTGPSCHFGVWQGWKQQLYMLPNNCVSRLLCIIDSASHPEGEHILSLDSKET